MDTHTIESSTGSSLVFDVWPAGAHWMMLIHGLSSNAKTWWQVAERLAANGVSTITVDQRSHGRSAVADDGYDWSILAADLVRIMDAADAGRVIAVGQSWGASVALETAARHSDRVAGLACVDGASFALRSKFPTWEACRTALRPAEIPPVSRGVMRGFIRDAHPAWSEAGIEGTLGNFREVNERLERALPIPHHMEIVRTLWDHDPGPVYADIEPPSLVITAASTEDAVEVAADEVIAMPGDHDLHVEQPDGIARLLRERASRWLD